MPIHRCPRCGWKLGNKQFTNEVRQSYPRAYAPWKPEEDKKLGALVVEQAGLPEMVEALGRQPSAILRRIEMLQIRECEPAPKKETFDSLQYLRDHESG